MPNDTPQEALAIVLRYTAVGRETHSQERYFLERAARIEKRLNELGYTIVSTQQLCPVCFTSSMEPTETGRRCLCCWQKAQLEAERQRVRALEHFESEFRITVEADRDHFAAHMDFGPRLTAYGSTPDEARRRIITMLLLWVDAVVKQAKVVRHALGETQ